MTKTSKWPCVFSGRYIREAVDPAIEAGPWPGAPYGNLRRLWKQQHCRTLNPYGSEDCPYSEVDCAVEFWGAVLETVTNAKKNRTGYFRSVALSSAARRADTKPVGQVRGYNRTGVQGQRPGHPRGSDPSSPSGRPVRGTVAGLQRAGTLLGADDPGPREDDPAHGPSGRV